MSQATAIEARGLGKKFMMATGGQRRTLSNRLRAWFTGNSPQRELWALRGVSFELKRGEVLGVIGPNGAGKSTLLLLLAQILAPSEGRLIVNGRTDPFFRLAMSLQPRLTVIENFSLCAALLGMPRREFRRRFPAMLEFSGLEHYQHARYGELSTGLAARLPFSTAIHTELDIILVDEMLAVGDRSFQAKCLRVFRDFKTQGRTLVIASHSEALVEPLCTRILYLNGGGPAFLGETREALRLYREDQAAQRTVYA